MLQIQALISELLTIHAEPIRFSFLKKRSCQEIASMLCPDMPALVIDSFEGPASSFRILAEIHWAKHLRAFSMLLALVPVEILLVLCSDIWTVWDRAFVWARVCLFVGATKWN